MPSSPGWQGDIMEGTLQYYFEIEENNEETDNGNRPL